MIIESFCRKERSRLIKMNIKTIGIIGGMGPEATNQLCNNITRNTPAQIDQDHIPVICYNNPNIPDRTMAILYNGEDPVPEMVKTAKSLEDMGVDFLLMPCNTAHFFIEEVQDKISVPIINMIEETILFIRENFPEVKKVGLLATSGTVKSGVYSKGLLEEGIITLIPNKNLQEDYVMEAIYGLNGIKAGHIEKPKELLNLAANELIKEGAEIIIAGCTEIPLALKNADLDVPLINPSLILTKKSIEIALSNDNMKIVVPKILNR